MRKESTKNNDISIFVEERVEYIHSRIALRPWILGIEQAAKLSGSYGTKVNTSLGRILNTRIKILNKKVDKKLSLLSGDVLVRNQRQKRAIEMIGNLISKLFGNPGPEDWKQNTKNILAMKAAIEKQIENSAIQHRDIDQNRHAINEHIEVLNQVSKTVFNNVNRLDSVDNALTEWESFLELESMFNSIIEILEALEDIKRDAKTGRCNEKGLNSKFLIDRLREIESNKDGIAPIFASWEWQKYYSYEMCAIALHEDELWITIRLPIVVLSEELTRIVPLSNQRWIKQFFNELGFDTTLFKYKQTDTYMIITNNNLDLCSKFGSSRVCNVRKTRFREDRQYIVPLDINQNRVLIISNSVKTNTSAQTLCSDNWSSAQQVMIEGHTVVKVPESCSLVSKSFEISKKTRQENVAIKSDIGEIMNVEFHLLRGSQLKNVYSEMMTPLPSLSNIVERNNNLTKNKLNEIEFKSWSHDRIILASSSSLTLILLIIAVIIISVYCCKKCRKNSSRGQGDVILNINDQSRCNETDSILKKNSSNVENGITSNSNKDNDVADMSNAHEDIAKPVKSQFRR